MIILKIIFVPHIIRDSKFRTSRSVLIRPMKDGQRRQHFADNDAVRAAVKMWVDSTLADFYNRDF